LVRRIKDMVMRNLFGIAIMGIPLAFALLLYASQGTTPPSLSVILFIGSGVIFLGSIIGLGKANETAKQQDDEAKIQREKLLRVLDEINEKLKQENG